MLITMAHSGRTVKTLCEVKDNRHKRPHVISFTDMKVQNTASIVIENWPVIVRGYGVGETESNCKLARRSSLGD